MLARKKPIHVCTQQLMSQLQVIWILQLISVYIISLFPPHAEIHSPCHTSPISDHHLRSTVIAKRQKFVVLGRKFQKTSLCNLEVATLAAMQHHGG